MPTRCPCGGRIIDEVRVKEEYDTRPGKRFFSCINYEADGLHYRQPWVIGVRGGDGAPCVKRVEEADGMIKCVSILSKQIESLEAQVKRLTLLLDKLTVASITSQSRLLTEKSSQTVEVGSSEAPKPAAERRKWTTQEDIVLISAWLNTSKDPIVSNQQKLGSFWRRIDDYFNASAQLGGFPPREWSQCKQRWGRVNEQVCKFVGSYEAALKEQSSEQNENDVMKSAHDIFFNDYQAKFTLEHAWRELKYDQKWRSNSISRDGAKEKMKEAAETVPDSDEARPPGVKACKAAKRKKHGNEAAFDRLESILEKKQNLSKQKILDRLLSKNIASLSEAEVALKDKLVSEML
uniref:Myb-like domain-containing protein n=1 Tax=Brassica oleracea TaxID=3712 RepID=A0A3P6CB67_BRAOL|nr:unnamed protein product [Brassica oleracea]